jgi:predicted pyridoxine 5'-phosphate oxidase superfamily flavin-nucleotide-binding protein
LDGRTLACADFRGNRQYISVGNLSANDRACLFLMDYPNRQRLKMYVRVESRSVADNPAVLAAVTPAGYSAKIERLLVFHLEAFDWNCPQHITPRFTEREMAEYTRARPSQGPRNSSY